MNLKLTALVAFACLCAFGQAAPSAQPLANVSLPPYVLFGASYNQQTGAAGVLSGIFPETSAVGGIYGSVTADIVPLKYTDPATRKTIYLVSGSFRAGQHKVLYNNGTTMLLIGGDLGASFSGSSSSGTASATTTAAGVNIGVAGSFTFTYVRQINAHWAVGVPVRMLWMSGVGPGGAGAWNPVAEAGVVWKP